MPTLRCYSSIAACLLLLLAAAAPAMEALDDETLADVHGQAIFFMDKIAPNGLPGAGGSGGVNDFTFYRMGLDVDMAFNLNIDRLQLGCGGSNENIVANGCDIDIDYLRFMGRAAGTSNPDAAVVSDFLTRRPYIEFAVRNDASKTQRDIAGVKIGFESADGTMVLGRTYANGQINVEHGGFCSTGSDQGAGALACHSGVRTLSGYVRAEMSAQVRIGTILGNAYTCMGNTAAADSASCDADDAYYLVRSGTRMTEIHDADIPATIYSGLFSPGTAAVDLRESLRMLHRIALDATQTKDFFLSFQREQIGWPKYDETGYAVTANTGWWMNIPYAAVKDLSTDVDYGFFGSIGLLFAIQEGVNITNLDLGTTQLPVSNCYNSQMFC